MTRENIIRMAREAGFEDWTLYGRIESKESALNRFADLVAAAEREACAKIVDEQGKGRKAMEHYAALTYARAAHDCAAAIRARSEK
jgi:hypothetical protein